MDSTRRGFLLGATAVGGAALGRRAAAALTGQSTTAHAGAGKVGSPLDLLEAHDSRMAAADGHAALAQPTDPRLPTQEEVDAWYTERRNWGRWGPNDQMGAVNLITPDKRVAAARLATTGRTVSLSRVFEPEQQFIRKNVRGRGGSVVDYYGFIYHGQTVTHVDALCHMWDEDGMWNGHDPNEEIDTRGARFGDITAWSEGLITRGVLLDVPRHRGEPYVTAEKPVHGWELEQIAGAQGVAVEVGDALLVHSGREEYERGGGRIGGGARPGLHVSCAKFIRDRDVALLGWDMMDARPNDYGLPFPVHGVLINYGVALLDNAFLESLAAACAEEGRYEFLFMALPLKVARGTGSPANPIAMF